MKIGELAKRISEMSNNFENNNSELKKAFLIKNILAFSNAISIVDTAQGSFGTGYPYYVLRGNFEGALPIIDEQISYNNKLVEDARENENKEWICARMLIRKLLSNARFETNM